MGVRVSNVVERELKTLEEAVNLIDEWISAYRELEGDLARLDHAWWVKYRDLERQFHATSAELFDLIFEEATARLANAESLPADQETGVPF